MTTGQQSSQQPRWVQTVLRFSAIVLAFFVGFLLLNLDFSRLGERAIADAPVRTAGGTAHFIAKWVDDSGAPATTADIKANGSDGPITIAYGASATISWTSTNTTSCTVAPGGWTGTSGSQSSGSLTSNTTYTLNCDSGAATDSVTVNVQALILSCSVAPTSATIGQSVTWTASGGVGPYTWHGTSPLEGRTGSSVAVSYSTTGTKTGSVTDSMSTTQACSNSVTVSSLQPPTWIEVPPQ